MKIQDLPEGERPREKALTYGIDSLNNRELLAILIRTGYRGCSALDIADNLLASFSSVSGILHASPNELGSVKGMSKTKALELLAIGELNKRDHLRILRKFEGPREIYEFYRKRWDLVPKEEVILLSFNRQKSLISEHLLSSNNQDFSSLSLGNTLAKALKDGAYGIVILHNHPSGFPLPSKEDIEATNELSRAASKLGIVFLDHLIAGEDSYYSFLEQGLFNG